MAKMVHKWSKNGRAATFGQSLGGHNSVTLHPILTNDPTKMISSSRRVEWWKDLSSISFRLDFGILSHFLPLVATWTTLGVWVQNYPQVVGTCPAHQPQPVSQNWCSRKNLSHTPPLRQLDHPIQKYHAPRARENTNSPYQAGDFCLIFAIQPFLGLTTPV